MVSTRSIPVLCVMAMLSCSPPVLMLRAVAALSAERVGLSSKRVGVLPLRVVSQVVEDRIDGSVHGHLNFPFATVRANLTNPAVWCAIIALHENVKGCVQVPRSITPVLRVYSGRKVFQNLDAAVRTDFVLLHEASTPTRLSMVLRAEHASWSRHQQYLALDARAAANGGTDVDLHYRYRLSGVARTSLRPYLATRAQARIGFTVVGRDTRGQPVYVSGARGLIERNAVRYYLAMLVYLDSRTAPTRTGDEWRAGRWYDLTEHYPAQLHELDRTQYLANKHREFAQQSALQAKLDQRADASWRP